MQDVVRKIISKGSGYRPYERLEGFSEGVTHV